MVVVVVLALVLLLLLLTSDDGGHVQDGQIVGAVRHGASRVAVVDALHVGKESNTLRLPKSDIRNSKARDMNPKNCQHQSGPCYWLTFYQQIYLFTMAKSDQKCHFLVKNAFFGSKMDFLFTN